MSIYVDRDLRLWTRERVQFRQCRFVLLRRVDPDYPDLNL